MSFMEGQVGLGLIVVAHQVDGRLKAVVARALPVKRAGNGARPVLFSDDACEALGQLPAIGEPLLDDLIANAPHHHAWVIAVAEHGVAAEEFWPQNAIDRRYLHDETGLAWNRLEALIADTSIELDSAERQGTAEGDAAPDQASKVARQPRPGQDRSASPTFPRLKNYSRLLAGKAGRHE